MSSPISVQLYSLRKEMENGNHLKILKKVSDMGYAGVEGAGLYGMKPREFRKAVEDLGMAVSSNHMGVTKENLNEAIDLHRELGTQFVVGGFWGDEFKQPDAVAQLAERYNFARDALAKVGL